jgi:hypothetical protein
MLIICYPAAVYILITSAFCSGCTVFSLGNKGL